MKVRIEKLVYGGDGLGHWKGRATFLPFVLPGELVTARVVRSNRKVLHALPLALEESSAERIEARCPYFTRCGGCHYQHMEYERQVATKTAIWRETLRHIGKIDWSGPIVAHPSPPWAYRNRAQFQLVRAAGQLRVGYYRAGSHALCRVETCPILSPKLETVLGALNRAAANGRVPDAVRQVEAFVDDRDEALLLSVAGPGLTVSAEALHQGFASELSGLRSLLAIDTASPTRDLAGPGSLDYHVGEHNYCVSHESFFQVNRFLVPEMVEAAMAGLAGEHALDLYAGVGLFTLPLAKRFGHVGAIESSAAACKDLRANTARFSGVEIFPAEVADFLSQQHDGMDAVLLDPPRTGAGAAVVQELLRLRPGRIIYVSCDPATLARDLQPLVGAGFAIEAIHFFDIFPQTYHLETIVHLRLA